MMTASDGGWGFSNEQLREIAWAGTPLFDRPSVGDGPAGQTPDLGWWGGWMNVLGLDDPSDLSRRLALDGMTSEGCARLTAKRPWPEKLPLPRWAESLPEIAGEFHRGVDGWERDPARKPDDPQPFEDVLLPVVRYARNRLNALAGGSSCLWLPAAEAALDHHLLTRLCSVSALALGRTFHLFRALRQMQPADGTASPPLRYHRDAFLASFASGSLVGFLLEYPVLARLLVLTTEAWVEMVAELRQRLDQDLESIAGTFFAGTESGAVAGVRLGLSDPHHGQKTVCILRFSSGREVVYKPRSLAPDAGFYALQDWLNRAGRVPALYTPRVLDRETHGWMEYVRPEPCAGPGEVAAFYERAGALLCLTYLTQATDLHCENVLARRDCPVLVDLETATHPLLRPLVPSGGAEADLLADDLWAQSVARTGLLPEWESGRHGRSFDVGGLGANSDQPTGFLHPSWEGVETDEVRLVWQEGVVKVANNLPVLSGRRVPLSDHGDDLLRGFSAAYRTCLGHRGELASPDGPLGRLVAARVRFVFRPTRHYLELLSRLRHPEFLRDGVARSVEIDRLVPAFQDPASGLIDPAHWGIYARERAALERLDVPHFAVDPETRDVTDAGAVAVREFLEASTRELVGGSVRRLGGEDLQRQEDYLRALLYAHRVAIGDGPPQVEASRPQPGENGSCRLDRTALLDEAGRVADHIRECALRAGDGSLSWICLASAAESGRLRVQPMGHKLYSGRAGVALFLAASAMLGREDHLGLARAALLPVRSLARNSKLLRRYADTVSIGMGDGLGGIVYALVRIGGWVGDAALLDEAVLLGSALTEERLSGHPDNDVLSGQAGALLGLSCLFKATGEAALLDKVRGCAERLLDRSEVPASGQRVWRSAEGAEAGFAHGAGGIAMALFRAAGVTGEQRFAGAGAEALAFTRARFREHAARSRFPHAWCRGLPGFALSLLGGGDGGSTEDLDLEAALREIASNGLDGTDHLCCGQMGRADVLLTAGQRRGQDELIDTAHRVAAGVVGRYHRQKGFALYAQDAASVPSPSLFQGTAGIGYQLLRLAYPDRVPSLLLFE